MVKNSGVMTLASPTAVALWYCEIVGQISDGMWENSYPTGHWAFWCQLDVKHSTENTVVVGNHERCLKNNYALTRLYNEKFDDGEYILRGRMLAYGRMVKAGVDPTDRELCSTGEYMPKTLAEFLVAKASNKWEYDFVSKRMEHVTIDVAEKFYAAEYTLKELIADIKLIKSTMKLVRC